MSLPQPGPLSADQRNLIKATAPILADKGLDITMYMYKNMISENNDLKALFNHSAQIVSNVPAIIIMDSLKNRAISNLNFWLKHFLRTQKTLKISHLY